MPRVGAVAPWLQWTLYGCCVASLGGCRNPRGSPGGTQKHPIWNPKGARQSPHTGRESEQSKRGGNMSRIELLGWKNTTTTSSGDGVPRLGPGTSAGFPACNVSVEAPPSCPLWPPVVGPRPERTSCTRLLPAVQGAAEGRGKQCKRRYASPAGTRVSMHARPSPPHLSAHVLALWGSGQGSGDPQEPPARHGSADLYLHPLPRLDLRGAGWI
jgi:hypothetical protein